MTYFLESAAIGLTKLTRREATERYVDWLNDREVTRTLVTGRFPQSIDDVESFVDSSNGPGRVTFAIYRKDVGGDVHVGNVKLDGIDWICRRAELGIMLGDRASWGHGIATEATRLVTQWAFDRLNLDRVFLGVLADNVAAVRVYEKLGYVVEGRMRAHERTDQGPADILLMAASAGSFHRKKPVVAVIQARMTSTRLPGKVLMPLAGKSALAYLVERVRRASTIDEVVVATSTHDSDDAIEAECKRIDARVVRGDLLDVLKRYHTAAVASGAEAIVRITADCPLMCPDVIDDVVARFHAESRHVDYCSNVDERTYPDGLDVEVFTRESLDEAAARAAEADREHVTDFIRRRRRKVTVSLPVDLHELRYTLDYEEDRRAIAAVVDVLGSGDWRSDALYRVLRERPALLWLDGRRAPDDRERERFVARLTALAVTAR